MSDQQHTPAPWTVEEIGQDDGYGHVYISGHITSPLHTYAGNNKSRKDSITAPDSMTRADARLIAAAPDLLAALESMLHEFAASLNSGKPVGYTAGSMDRAIKAIVAAEAAIDKARGTEHG